MFLLFSSSLSSISDKYIFLKILFIYFKREGEGERERRNSNVWLLLACPLLGTWPETQAFALSGG